MATKPKSDAAWLKAHPGWKAKTQARWAANHPQPLFPSTDIKQSDLSRLLGSARQQVTKTYAATPLPSLQNYLQPFADAQARNQGYAANYDQYLQQAAGASQNISGAFNQALTGGVNAGAAQVASQGGSGMAGAIPSAQQALTPMSMTGSSFTQYLNAERPYVQTAANAASRDLNSQQASALTDYRDAEAKRRAEIQDAIQQLYKSNVDTLQNTLNSKEKAAVTEYLALGKTAYQQQQARTASRKATNTAAYQTAQTKLGRDKLNETKSYHQASLNKKHDEALAKGVDLSPIYKTLFVSNGSVSKTGRKLGKDGQSGGVYTVVRQKFSPEGVPLGDTKVEQLVPYGKTVPKSTTWTNPDGSTGSQKVTLKKQVFPPKGSTGSSRVATAASWDRAWTQLKAAYLPKGFTEAYLKSLMPARPAK